MDMKRAGEEVDTLTQRVADLQKQKAKLEKELADALKDRNLAQMRLDEFFYRQRRDSEMPLSDIYQPKIYKPEEDTYRG